MDYGFNFHFFGKFAEIVQWKSNDAQDIPRSKEGNQGTVKPFEGHFSSCLEDVKLSMEFYGYMCIQWKFQDPKMEVLYHIESYFWCLSPYIGIIHTRYPQFRYLKWSLHILYIYIYVCNYGMNHNSTYVHGMKMYEVCRYTCRYMLPSKAIT
jgi:hypothetical protein